MKFSVIVPIYNVEDYLRACVDSVLAQDFRDYEIILVDDGSPDNCGKICDEYAEKYSQIKTIHKENGGLSDARNFGIKEAEGDYLIFLDSDDYWEGTNVLSDLSDILERDNNPDLILHGYTTNNKEGKKHREKIKIKENQGFENDFEYLVSNHIYVSNAWTKIIKKDILIKNNLFFEKGLLHEDMPFCFDLSFFINTYSVYNSNFYQYRLRDNSISFRLGIKNIEHLSRSILSRLDRIIQLDDNNLIKKGLKIYINNNFAYNFMYYIKLSFRDIMSIYFLQNKVWNKCCEVLGEKNIREKNLGNRKIKKYPFLLIILISYFRRFI